MLGQLIKQHRNSRQLKQYQLAERVGVHKTTISHLEADRIVVSSELIERIAREICEDYGEREQFCVAAGLFDSEKILQMAKENPIICRLLRRLPSMTQEQLDKISEVFSSSIEE